MRYVLWLVSIICLVSLTSYKVLAKDVAVNPVEATVVAYFEELYDVPVFDGLTVLTQQAMSFDKPDGRISQAVAFTDNKSWGEVLSFYKTTLAQMGWKHAEKGSFTREAEMLEISHEQEDSGLIIRFLLRPL